MNQPWVGILCALLHLIITSPLQDKYCYYTSFIDQKTWFRKVKLFATGHTTSKWYSKGIQHSLYLLPFAASLPPFGEFMKTFRGGCECSQRTLPSGTWKHWKSQISSVLKKLISLMALGLCWVEHILCLLFKIKYIDIWGNLYGDKFQFHWSSPSTSLWILFTKTKWILTALHHDKLVISLGFSFLTYKSRVSNSLSLGATSASRLPSEGWR